MNITMLGNAGSVILAPGRYWFGDPCYGLSDERYMALLKGAYTPVRSIDRDGRQGLVGQTLHGDGRYHDAESGAAYGVDSGQLAVLHEDMLDGTDIGDGRYFVIRHATDATFGSGVFVVEDMISVDTGADGPDQGDDGEDEGGDGDGDD